MFAGAIDGVSGMLEDGLFDPARDEIERMIEEFPERAEPFFLMGTCLAMQHEQEDAISFLNRAIALKPSPEAYYNLASAHQSLFQIEECVECLKKVIELDGKRGEYGQKATAQLDAVTRTIRETFGMTLHRFLKHKRRYERAFGHLMARRFSKAVRSFTEVLKVDPDHIQSHGNLGLAYAGLGDYDKALQHLDKAIELDPGYQPAIDNRRLILKLPVGESLDLPMRETDFYARGPEQGKPGPPGGHVERGVSLRPRPPNARCL